MGTSQNKKQILSDPLATFDTQSPVDSSGKREKLTSLCGQRESILQSQAKLQLQSKQASRQIGEVKRAGGDIGTLKTEMQSLSQKLKAMKTQLSAIEDEIIGYFATDVPTTEEPQQQTPRYTQQSLGDVTVRLLDDDLLTRHRLNWNHFVDSHPEGCIHHRLEWNNILNNSYGHECFLFIALDSNDDVVGVLPTVHLQSRLFGNLMCSMPYFQRGGALALHASIEERLIDTANDHARQLGIEHIEYRDTIERQGMPIQSHKVNMVLALPESSDDLWQAFSSKLRAQIRRPQREDTRAVIGHIELLDDFYTVYARNMRDLGSPVHSKKFIADILRAFPDNSWLCIIYLGKRAVSAGLLLGYGAGMEIPLASTVRGVNHLSINMLLYWNVLQFAIKQGYRSFDFGRSTQGASTYRFKKQWGAVAKPLYWHYWLNEGIEMPGLNPSNPKFALMIYLWKHLPLKLSKIIGPGIVKNIP